jgi:methionyl-tRNA formyltransferase
MKIIFMGTPQFAVPTLKALINSHHQLVGVYCQPPKMAGRGHKLTPSPIAQIAAQSKIPVFTPSSLRNKEALEIFHQHQADLAIVAAYGMILPKEILAAPKYGCLNLHPSDLPRWRGAAPIQRAIMAGDSMSAICVMQMDAGLDTGDILSRQEVLIPPSYNSQDWHDEASQLGSKLMLETIERLHELTPIKQSEQHVTYAKKLTKEEALINWHLSAQEINCQIKGLNPWPLAYFNFHHEPIKIYQAEIVLCKHTQNPGTILDEHLTIACGKDALRPVMVQRPSRKIMPASEMLKAFAIPAGSILNA